MNKLKNNSNRRKVDEEEDDCEEISDGSLGYVSQQKIYNRYTVFIDEPIKPASYYRNVSHMIANSKEGDFVEFEISSPGGYVNGLIALISAIQKSDSTKVAWINGECHSAASMLALSCDVIYVAPYATMLVHYIRFGSSGKVADVEAHVQHVKETSEMLFRDVYKYFLTEDEITLCLHGKEMYMSSEEIQMRLKRRVEMLDKEDDELLAEMQKVQEREKEVVKPKRKSKNKIVEETT